MRRFNNRNVRFNFSATQKKLMLAIGIATAATIIAAGYDTAIVKVKTCNTEVTRYVTAETSGVDFEGNYWSDSDRASPVFKAITLNSEVLSGSFDGEASYHPDGYYVPPMPLADPAWQYDSDFDNYDYVTKKTLKVGTRNPITNEFQVHSENARNTFSCVERLNTHVTVKTWYGITYETSYGE